MRELSERDKDNLAAILDYCDRISSIEERFGDSFEKNADLTVWNQDLYDVEESKLMDVTVNNVIFKGRSIYSGSGN